MTLIYRIENNRGEGLWCTKGKIIHECPIHSRNSVRDQFYAFPSPDDEGHDFRHWWEERKREGSAMAYLFAFPTVSKLKEFVTPQMMYVLRKLDMKVKVLEIKKESIGVHRHYFMSENQVAYHRHIVNTLCSVEAHRVDSIQRFIPLHKRAS